MNLMREALQRCYPANLILKPNAATEAAAKPTVNKPLHSNSSTPHPGLAFLPDPTPQQKSCSTARHQLNSQIQEQPGFEQGANVDRAAQEAASEATRDGNDENCRRFSECLRVVRWEDTFDVSKVTLEQISEASAVLMAHWQSAAEGVAFFLLES